MIGKPKFKKDDSVNFTYNGKLKVGTIYIIDAYGTFFDSSDLMIFMSKMKEYYTNIFVKIKFLMSNGELSIVGTARVC